MRLSPVIVAGLVVLGVLCVPEAHAQDNDAEPVWVQYTYHGFPYETATVDIGGGKIVKLGDPALGRWAIKQASRARKMKVEDLLNWLMVVEMYRVTEVNSAILGIIGRLDLKENDGSPIPWRLFDAAAATATPKSASKIKRLIDALEKMPFDDNTDKRARAKMRLAAALVRLDQDAGREILLDHFKKGVPKDRTDKQYDYSAVQRTLKSLGDPKLTKTVTGFQNQIGFVNKKSVMISMLYHMELINKPMDELWEIAKKESAASMERGYVVTYLAERAELKDIGQLKGLSLNGTGISKNPRTIKRIKEDWQELHGRSVVVMRCRLWRELKS